MSSREPTEEELLQLMRAAENGEIATLQDLIQKKEININCKGPTYPPWWGQTPLLVSARNNQSDAVDHLLQWGADINAVDWNAMTVLHCAAMGGNSSLVDWLINAGLDVHAVANNAMTVLHCAAMGGNSSLVDWLINAGLDVHAVANNKQSLLHLASMRGHALVVDTLIKNGAIVNQTDDKKQSPLHIASMTGHALVVDTLIKNGAIVNQTDGYDVTPLKYAVDFNHSAVVWTMVKNHKVDISQYDERTKWKISRLLAVEEERRKSQQDSLSSGMEDTDSKQNNQWSPCIVPESDLSGLTHEDINKVFMDSTLPSPDVKVAMMGTEGSGKTCLGDTLTGQEFKKDTLPTEGADEMEIIVKSAVDWNVITKEQMIDNLQQQVLQEVDHCATKPAPKDSTLPSSAASVGSSNLPKIKPNKAPIPSLPMLELPGGDKMYILTLEEFRKLPSIVEKYDPLRRYVNIWDSAGQQVFQHTHGLFVSEEVVCLIVFDASKLLDKVPERRYEGDKSPARSGLDTIAYWMDLISCRVSKKSTSDSDLSEFLPTFILIGTKIDLLNSDISKAEEIASQKIVPILKKKIVGKPFAKHIAGSKNGQLFIPGSQSIFFLSNRVRNDEVIKNLQHVVLQAASVKYRPTRLLKMERKLMLLSHQEKLSVVDKEQVKEVVRNCGISTNDKVVVEVLKFFHQKGTLLYFHQIPALSNVIILSPQWLAKLLTYILTNLLCQPAGPPLAQYAEERNSEGLLRQELLNFSIEQFLADEVNKGRKVPRLIGKDVVDLLLKFKLMVDVTNTPLATKKSKDKVFLVPHLLPVETFVPATNPYYKVLYHFPGKFIPDSLVDQLIVKCAKWNQQQNFGFIKFAYQWIIMELGNCNSYLLRSVQEDNLIELTIVSGHTLSNERELSALSNELIFTVKGFVKELMQETMTSAVEQFPVECYFPCQCNVLHVTVEKVAQTSSVYCQRAGQNVDMTKYHKMLSSGKHSTSSTPAISNVADTISHTEVSIQTCSDCSAAFAKLRQQYVKLMHLPVGVLLPSLYAKEVIDTNQKKTIEAERLDTKKMEYILDLIIDSLNAGVAIKYNSFLEAINETEDPVANEAIKNLALPVLTIDEQPQDTNRTNVNMATNKNKAVNIKTVQEDSNTSPSNKEYLSQQPQTIIVQQNQISARRRQCCLL